MDSRELWEVMEHKHKVIIEDVLIYHPRPNLSVLWVESLSESPAPVFTIAIYFIACGNGNGCKNEVPISRRPFLYQDCISGTCRGTKGEMNLIQCFP